ncbi:MAG: RNA polymerase sigma factor [Planctomycetota bacterium]|jgi:RNA polymerase sigma factor (sigma-70 family)
MPKTDAELIRLSLDGDKAAFGKLITRYVALAGGVAMSVLGDYDLASDAVQDSFLKAWNSLHTLRNTGSFKSWLCGIVKTTAIDRLRRDKGKTVSLTAADESAELIGDAKPHRNPAVQLEREELHGKILAAINELPQMYKEVVILKHIEDRSYREIADALGTSIASIESRLFRGRQMVLDKLKKYLEA